VLYLPALLGLMVVDMDDRVVQGAYLRTPVGATDAAVAVANPAPIGAAAPTS